MRKPNELRKCKATSLKLPGLTEEIPIVAYAAPESHNKGDRRRIINQHLQYCLKYIEQYFTIMISRKRLVSTLYCI